MSPHLALLMGGFVALAFLSGSFIAIFLIDRVGRRKVSTIIISKVIFPQAD